MTDFLIGDPIEVEHHVMRDADGVMQVVTEWIPGTVRAVWPSIEVQFADHSRLVLHAEIRRRRPE